MRIERRKKEGENMKDGTSNNEATRGRNREKKVLQKNKIENEKQRKGRMYNLQDK